jgi:hypothetical protein
MARRDGWRGKKWLSSENRNWKMGRGWRHVIGRAVFVFGEIEEKSLTQSSRRTRRALRREERKGCGVRS